MGLQKVSVGFNVNNLFDKRYITKYSTGFPGSAKDPLIKYNLPRSYYLSLEAQF
ncbi:hypothetical protein THICB2_580038 [Thiomonas sp. CB2]|nr:hypothetical protein THICB2_580038 [Thiomonas sp. CB2]